MHPSVPTQIPSLRFRTGFDPALSQTMVFHAPEGSVAKPFMCRRGAIEHGRLDRSQLIAMDMGSKSDPVTLFIVLPDQDEDVEHVFDMLDERQLRGCPMVTEDGFLAIPRFSYPSRNSEPFISLVVHKARIEVREDGCEAAAVTAISMCLERVVARVLDIRVDRPFAFVLSRESGVLGAGVVQSPQVN